jgi:glycosyltransferase involved in cell wall biosynthesis
VKIILVHNYYQQPGGEDVVFQQERELLERAGHDVVAYRRSNREVDSYTGVKRLVLVRKTIWADDTRREFAELLRAERPDLVHIHNTFVMISPSIYAACREARVPVVQTLHNYRLLCPAATFFRSGSICEECMEHTLWRSVRYGCYRDSRPGTAAVALMLAVHRSRHTWVRDVTCYIALTEFARTKFLQGGLPAQKVYVKPNFVYPDPRPGTDDGKYVMFAGRLSPEKRVSTLLKACVLLRNEIPLVIVGGGPQQQELKQEAARCNLTKVDFRGALSHDQTLAAMKGARLLIFSSEWYETFGLTIAEAFACGVPVICSRLGAMKEIVEDGRTGLYFAAGDAGDLAEKVNWAWNRPERMRSMGMEARQEYENKYTAEKNYPMLMDIYRRAIAANA